MGAVQASELHQLVALDIADELRTGNSPVGTPRRKIVLDHPLAKGFMDDGCKVELTFCGGNTVEIAFRRGGCYAVDHATGKADLGFDPGGKPWVDQDGEFGDDATQHGAVCRKIVAAQHGEGRLAGLATALQAGNKEPDHRPRGVQIANVMTNVGVIRLQPAGQRVMAVPLFGHGQGDDPRGGIRQRGYHVQLAFRCQEYVTYGADLACLITVGAALHGGVLAALRNKLVEGGTALQAYRRDPPVATGRGHGLVRIGRDKGAEKSAGAEMDDSASRNFACSDKPRRFAHRL